MKVWLVSLIPLWSFLLVAGEEPWPCFRGPLGTGASLTADPPIEWAEDKNVKWKTALPGLGHSSPVVWDDLVFVTSAVPVGKALNEPKWSERPGAHNNLPITRENEFVALAVNRATGEIVWKTVLHRQLPHEGGHETGSLASATPAVDSDLLFAFFGSYGLFALSHEGEIQWQVDLGDQFTKHGHGEGSSPALSGDYLAVNWDTEERSFITTFDKTSGKIIWQKDREERTSWASPIIIEEAGRPQLIVSGTTAIRAYDLETGDEIWSCRGLSNNVVASPVAEPGFVYAGSSYEFQAMMAIRIKDARGDVTDTDHVIWKRRKRTPYVPSPLLYKGTLYFLAHYQGVMTRVVGQTGQESGPFRLLGLREVYASPVAAQDRIYWLDRSGVCMIIGHGETPKPLALNRLVDRFSASPALIGRELLLRGEKFLYCVSH